MKTQTTRTIFYFFLIFILINSVIATTRVEKTTTTIVLNETFNYTSTYAGNGWTYLNGACGNFPTTPQPSSFGVNNTALCGFGFAGTIRRDTGTINISNSSKYVILYDYTGDGTGNGMSLQFRQKASNPNVEFDITTTVTDTVVVRAFSGGENCTVTGSYNDERAHEVAMELDTNLNQYDLFVDGVPECVDYSLGNRHKQLEGITMTGSFLAGTTPISLVDNILVAEGSIQSGVQECSFPTVFCDNFNYDPPLMSMNDWFVYNSDDSLNTSFAPDDNTAKMTSVGQRKLFHIVNGFQMGWQVTDGFTAVAGVEASQFTQEFDLNLSAGTLYSFTRDNLDAREVFDINFSVNNWENITVSYRKTDGEWGILCGNCTSTNQFHNIKIRTNWKQRSTFFFNSTFVNDTVLLYIDGILAGSYINFIDPTANNQNKHMTWTDFNSKAVIDNYLVYVGSDAITSTLDVTQTNPLEVDTNVSVTTGSGDLFTEITSLWSTFGLKTVASRVIFGIMFLMVCAAIIIMVMLQVGVFSFLGLITILSIVAIAEVFVGLIPLWIFGVGSVVAIAIAIIAIKSMAQ